MTTTPNPTLALEAATSALVRSYAQRLGQPVPLGGIDDLPTEGRAAAIADMTAALDVLLDVLAIDNPFAQHYPASSGGLDDRLDQKNGCSCGHKLIGGRAHHLVTVLRTAILGGAA